MTYPNVKIELRIRNGTIDPNEIYLVGADEEVGVEGVATGVQDVTVEYGPIQTDPHQRPIRDVLRDCLWGLQGEKPTDHVVDQVALILGAGGYLRQMEGKK